MKEKHNFKYVCWILIASFYLLENCIQVSQNVLTNMMQNTLNLHDTAFSTVVACYFWGYSFAQIPAGMLLDKFGLKKPLVISLLICGLGTVLLSQAEGFYSILTFRTAIGVVSAFAALSVLNYTASKFDDNKFATLTGLMLTIGMCGQIFGEAPLHYLAISYGWRNCILFLGLSALVLTLLNTIVLKPEKTVSSNVKMDFQSALSSKNIWYLAIYGMLRFTPFLLLVTYWGNPLMHKIHGFSDTTSSEIISMLPLGFAIGAPIWGRISDKMQSRMPGLLASNILEIGFWILLLVKFNQIGISIIALALGFTVSGFLPAFTIMKEIAPKEIRTTALGFMNTLNSIGTPMAMPILAYLAKSLSASKTLMILPGITFCAIIVFLLIGKTNK